MNFYLEAMQNDVDVSALDCEIELDKVQLTIDYYSNQENLYKESCSEEEFYTESSKKISDTIKNAIKAVITFVTYCTEKIKELIAKKHMNKLIDEFNKICKQNPNFKDETIELEDLDAIKDDIENNNETYSSMCEYLAKEIKDLKYYLKHPDEYKRTKEDINKKK